MKKYLFVLSAVAFIFLAACQSPDTHVTEQAPKTLADSLLGVIDEAHIVGMKNMGKLTRFEQQARHLLDSLEKLPAAARRAASPYRAQLDTLFHQLSYAESAMDKWMQEFRQDSAINDVSLRIRYLQSEMLTVGQVKNAIVEGLAKAEGLLNVKGQK